MPKPSKYVHLGNGLSLFWLISYFWKFWPKKKPQKTLFGQNFIFGAKNAKIFKNKKLIKKWKNIP